MKRRREAREYMCIAGKHLITRTNEKARYCPQCARNRRRRKVLRR